MKKFLLVGLLGVVTLCGLSSCDDDDDGGYVPFSYAVGDMVVKDGSEPYIQLDSKQTLFPSNGSRLPNYLLKDGKWVIISFLPNKCGWLCNCSETAPLLTIPP